MAVRISIINLATLTAQQLNALNSLQLAGRDIPDAALPLMQEVLPGSTPAEDASLLLDWIAKAIRLYLKDAAVNLAVQAPVANVESTKTTKASQINADWPES